MLAACTQLRDLRLAGGSAHGNPICQLPALHLALAAVLPQVTAVDSAPACAIGCISGSPADAQVLAALQLKAFQTSMPVSHKHDGIPDQALHTTRVVPLQMVIATSAKRSTDTTTTGCQ